VKAQAAYTNEVLELCALADASFADARGFISASTPVAKIREQLAAKRAKAADAVVLSTAPAAAPTANAGWDDVIAKTNATFGIQPRK
jgi:hypothetical protein